jgi:hypothetical protein
VIDRKANLYALDLERWNWNRPVYCSDADRAKFDALPTGPSDETVTVLDTERRLLLTIRRTSCGAGCYCAAEVIREEAQA